MKQRRAIIAPDEAFSGGGVLSYSTQAFGIRVAAMDAYDHAIEFVDVVSRVVVIGPP